MYKPGNSALDWTLWLLSRLFTDNNGVEEVEAYRSFLPDVYVIPSDERHVENYGQFLLEWATRHDIQPSNPPKPNNQQHPTTALIGSPGNTDGTSSKELHSALASSKRGKRRKPEDVIREELRRKKAEGV